MIKKKKPKQTSFWKPKAIPKGKGFNIGAPLKNLNPLQSKFIIPKIPSYLTSHSKPQKLRKYIGKKKMLHNMDGVSFSIFRGPRRLTNKQLTWPQAKMRFPRLKPMVDTDRDGVINLLDCRPLNKKKQGFEHRKSDVKTRQPIITTYSWQTTDDKGLIHPSEKAKFMYHGRSTGHFGTGIYAYTSKEQALKEKRTYPGSKLIKVDIQKPLIVKPTKDDLGFIDNYGFHAALRQIQNINPKSGKIEDYNNFHHEKREKPLTSIKEQFEKQGITVEDEELISARKEWEKTGVQPSNIILKKKGYGGVVPESEELNTHEYGAVKFEEEDVPIKDFEELESQEEPNPEGLKDLDIEQELEEEPEEEE